MKKKKTVHSGTDTKTEKQWLKEGRLLKTDAVGEHLWTNRYCQISAVYYSVEETYQGTVEEIRTVRESELAKKREYAKKKRELLKARKFRETELSKAHEMQSIPCDNPSKVVVFDTETTGLNPFEEEILQLAIMDGDGNILLNTYIKPYLKKSWHNAEQIHGISPNMVADAPYMHELIPQIKGIFESAELLVTYNGEFDERFLDEYGIKLSKVPEFDVMLEFAPIYGKWNGYYDYYEWQELSICASYYGYEFKAHDALEDVKATLHCYKCMVNK